MSDQSFDDFLKRTLNNSSDYIADDDFTARVMASLPAGHRLPSWLEKLIVALPATFIALLVGSQIPWRDVIRPAYAWVLTADLSSVVSLAIGLMLLAMAVPLYFVFGRQSQM